MTSSVYLLCGCVVCVENTNMLIDPSFHFSPDNGGTHRHTHAATGCIQRWGGLCCCAQSAFLCTQDHILAHIPCSHCNMPTNKYLEINIPKSVGFSTVEPLLPRQPWDRRKCPDGTGLKVHKHGIWGSTVCLLNCPYFKVIKEVPLVCLREV